MTGGSGSRGPKGERGLGGPADGRGPTVSVRARGRWTRVGSAKIERERARCGAGVQSQVMGTSGGLASQRDGGWDVEREGRGGIYTLCTGVDGVNVRPG